MEIKNLLDKLKIHFFFVQIPELKYDENGYSLPIKFFFNFKSIIDNFKLSKKGKLKSANTSNEFSINPSL